MRQRHRGRVPCLLRARPLRPLLQGAHLFEHFRVFKNPAKQNRNLHLLFFLLLPPCEGGTNEMGDGRSGITSSVVRRFTSALRTTSTVCRTASPALAPCGTSAAAA